MRRIVLFSEPGPDLMIKLKPVIFAEFLKDKIFAYMPSEGDASEANAKYTPFWQQYAENNGAKFVFIDNSQTDDLARQESEKLLNSDILMITGGNTYKLLNNLRKSGLDETIKKFHQKNNTVIAGFSAGALVLTPTIAITAKVGDSNNIGLVDFSGLGLVNFEVYVHYDPSSSKKLENYQKSAQNEVKTIANDQYIIVDK